jgi:hypothetical protein
MRPPLPKRHLLANVVFAALLVAAQLAAVVHAFEHEPGTPQSKVCATCVTAANLGAATVGQPATLHLAPAPCDFAPDCEPTVRFLSIPAARQRGPPLPLPTP